MRRRTSASWLALRSAVGVIYVFMLGPILITATVAFNLTDRSYFPPRGFSLHWWGQAFSPQWTGAFAFSLELATLSAVATAIAGLPLALAFRRYQFPGKALIQAMTLGPLVLPSLVTGIALLQFLTLARAWVLDRAARLADRPHRHLPSLQQSGPSPSAWRPFPQMPSWPLPVWGRIRSLCCARSRFRWPAPALAPA